MKKILLINQGNTENLGDIAIKEASERIFRNLGYDVDFVGYGQIKKKEMPSLNSLENKSSRKNIPNFLKWLLKFHWDVSKAYKKIKNEKYEFVVIGGGQLLKTKSVFNYVLMSWCFFLNGKKIYLLGVGADDKFSYIEKLTYKYSFKKIKEIYVRDKDSIKTLKTITEKQINYFPDFVMSEENIKSDEISNTHTTVMIYNYETLKKHFFYNKTKKEYYDEWIELIDSNKLKQNLVKFAYSASEDKIETKFFISYINNRFNLNIEFKENCETLNSFKKVLSSTGVLISGRMHGLIIGKKSGCKILPYIVSKKLETFSKEYVEIPHNFELSKKEIERNIDKLFKIL